MITVILFRYHLAVLFMLLFMHAGMWLSLFSININHKSFKLFRHHLKTVTHVFLLKARSQFLRFRFY